jgi:hypothetical protein
MPYTIKVKKYYGILEFGRPNVALLFPHWEFFVGQTRLEGER